MGGKPLHGPGYRFANTLLRVSGKQFLANPESLQTEGFGPLTLGVVVDDDAEMLKVARAIEGSLTGSIYSAKQGGEDELAMDLMRVLRRRVGRVLNDKMPTGVAVSPAMNHGGPFPATGHPGFTAVGLPASIRRFAKLDCYDNVRPERLPNCLRPA
jgi:NADP-dependent aldehyde dehydrogenase